jgi:hypothetical protein
MSFETGAATAITNLVTHLALYVTVKELADYWEVSRLWSEVVHSS